MHISRPTLSVLIVEDEGASRLALVRLLGALGFETHAAGTVAGARAVLSRQRPDLMLLNAHLPDGQGTDILKEIRGNAEPVIVAMMSTLVSESRFREIADLEPDALFEKPIDLDEFKIWLLGQLSECADLTTRETPGYYASQKVNTETAKAG